MKTLFHRGELPLRGKPVYFVRREIDGEVYLIGQITWVGGRWVFRAYETNRRFDFDTLAEAKDEARKV